MHSAYRCGTRRVTVGLQRAARDRFTVTLDGTAVEVEATLVDPDTVHLVIGGTAHTLPVVRVGGTYQVAIAGEVYTLAPDSAGSVSSPHAAVLAPPQIVAPMPGKVLQVLVRTGQEVAAGDGLLVLEAMKMEHRIVAEAPATVRAVHVESGQMVDAGAVLVELEY
jgi:biotin carboxyl carrier protein